MYERAHCKFTTTDFRLVAGYGMLLRIHQDVLVVFDRQWAGHVAIRSGDR